MEPPPSLPGAHLPDPSLMPEPRKILRLDPSGFRPGERLVITHIGIEIVLPKGFRANDLRPKASLTDERLEELRSEIEAFRAAAPVRAAERAAKRVAERPTEGEITALAPIRDRRFAVYIDGRYTAAVSSEQIGELNLVVGRRLDAAETRTVVDAGDEAAALRKIDAALAYAPRTAEELRLRLRRKKVEITPAVERAIARRLGSGVMADADYVAYFARSRGEAKGKGYRALTGEMRRRGVSDEAIREGETDFDAEAALSVAATKAARGIDPTDEKHRRRFLQRLMSRGFGYAEAAKEIAKISGQQSDDEEDE